MWGTFFDSVNLFLDTFGHLLDTFWTLFGQVSNFQNGVYGGGEGF